MIGIPLVPLVLEGWVEHSVKNSSWAITAAIYCICVGAASREGAVFACSALASLLASAAYGVVEASPNTTRPEVANISFWVIAIFSVALIIERFIRHVLERTPFFEFK